MEIEEIKKLIREEARKMVKEELQRQLEKGVKIGTESIYIRPDSINMSHGEIHNLGELPTIQEHGEYLPITQRAQNQAHVYYDEPYFTCTAETRPADVTPEFCSWITFKQYGYGTYQVVGRCSMCPDGDEFIWGFEHHHGYGAEGVIVFWCDHGTAKVYQSWAGTTCESFYPGADWTSETTFKIDWSSTRVVYYTDGTILDTLTCNVP